MNDNYKWSHSTRKKFKVSFLYLITQKTLMYFLKKFNFIIYFVVSKVNKLSNLELLF